jgi:8-oxo-dGTP diphosphatase
MDETLEEAVARELQEETGLTGISLRQLGAYSTIDRDPRARTIAIAFFGFADASKSTVKGGDDADSARWFPVDDVPQLAFDHADILKAGVEKLS